MLLCLLHCPSRTCLTVRIFLYLLIVYANELILHNIVLFDVLEVITYQINVLLSAFALYYITVERGGGLCMGNAFSLVGAWKGLIQAFWLASNWCGHCSTERVEMPKLASQSSARRWGKHTYRPLDITTSRAVLYVLVYLVFWSRIASISVNRSVVKCCGASYKQCLVY